MKLKIPPLNWESAFYIAFILIALLTRFWGLGARTLSYDESIHAFYSWKLANGQGYIHDPITHGPFLFFANALLYLLLGASDYTSRLLPALFGVILVGLPCFLRRWLGRTGALVSSGLILISPSLLYYSRYLRNDIYIAVWTVLMLLVFFRYLDDRQEHWLYLGAAALALSLCTKEVAFFHGFIFLTFILLAAARVFPSLKNIKPRSLIICLMIIIVIFVTFYSAFFTNLSGLASGTVGSATHWLSRHPATQSDQPWYYYFFLLPLYEFLPLILALAGTGYFLIKLIKKRPIELFNYFLIYWWIMAWLIYTWAGEKMPWLMLHILLPAILLAGSAAGGILQGKRRQAFAAGFLLLCALTLRFSWMANFAPDEYSREFLAFAQASRDVKLVMKQIEEIGGKQIRVAFDNQSAWPFAWYLREFPRQTYYGSNPDAVKLNAPVIIAGPENEQRVKAFLGKRYSRFCYRLLSWPIKVYAEHDHNLWDVFFFRRYNIPPDSWPKVQPFALYVRKDALKGIKN
jgi:uncharacterized protein (TIGR03663 family)